MNTTWHFGVSGKIICGLGHNNPKYQNDKFNIAYKDNQTNIFNKVNNTLSY